MKATRKRAHKAKLAKPIKKSADALLKSLKAIEDALIQSKSKSPQDPLNFPVRLNDKVGMLLNLGNRDPRPTEGQRAVLASLHKRAEVHLQALATALAEQVPAFNAAVAKAAIPAVILELPEAPTKGE